MDRAQTNAAQLDAAAWRMRWDRAVGWACGPCQLQPRPFAGGLILRRWKVPKYPRPTAPAAVGFAPRTAAYVTEGASVTTDASEVWIYAVDRVSAGGVLTEARMRTARAVPFTDAAVPLSGIPNPPLDVHAEQGPDGKLWIHWAYHETDQQVAPDKFYIYSDSGSGTLSSTAIASVSYIPGCRNYAYRLASDDWDGWMFLVLAETVARVKSLAALPNRAGCSPTYGLAAEAARIATRQATAPTATEAVPMAEY